jgi:hypothetical protein
MPLSYWSRLARKWEGCARIPEQENKLLAPTPVGASSTAQLAPGAAPPPVELKGAALAARRAAEVGPAGQTSLGAHGTQGKWSKRERVEKCERLVVCDCLTSLLCRAVLCVLLLSFSPLQLCVQMAST